jgi:hypothetical protein
VIHGSVLLSLMRMRVLWGGCGTLRVHLREIPCTKAKQDRNRHDRLGFRFQVSSRRYLLEKKLHLCSNLIGQIVYNQGQITGGGGGLTVGLSLANLFAYCSIISSILTNCSYYSSCATYYSQIFSLIFS